MGCFASRRYAGTVTADKDRREQMSELIPSPMLNAVAAPQSLWDHIWNRQPDSTDLRLKIAYLGLQVLDLILTQRMLFSLSYYTRRKIRGFQWICLLNM